MTLKRNYYRQKDLRRFSGRVKSRKEVAKEYGICTRTLLRWFKKEGFTDIPRELLRPVDLMRIYQTFGLPEKDIDEMC